jgi:hypothetical protein
VIVLLPLVLDRLSHDFLPILLCPLGELDVMREYLLGVDCR